MKSRSHSPASPRAGERCHEVTERGREANSFSDRSWQKGRGYGLFFDVAEACEKLHNRAVKRTVSALSTL